MFLLKIGDNVKKQNFLPSSGRASGQRIRELGGRSCASKLCATVCHESHQTQDCLEVVGPQPQKTKIAHNKEHETIIRDCTAELFCSISNINVQCCCLSCTAPSVSAGFLIPSALAAL